MLRTCACHRELAAASGGRDDDDGVDDDDGDDDGDDGDADDDGDDACATAVSGTHANGECDDVTLFFPAVAAACHTPRLQPPTPMGDAFADLIHLPDLINRYGPLPTAWSLERKHKIIKKVRQPFVFAFRAQQKR